MGMTKRLSRAELDALAADTITKQTQYIERLETLVKRAGGEPILNDDRAELAKAPAVAKAIGEAMNGKRDQGSQTVMPGKAALPIGAGTWTPVAVDGPVTKSRTQRDEDEQAEVIAKRRQKIRNDINSALGGSR